MDKTLIELTTQECHQLLGRHSFGRLAFLDRAGEMPMIIPVNYLFQKDTVVFRTDPGRKLIASLHEAPVAFEVDGTDDQQQLGWSVVVRGYLDEVSDADELAELAESPLTPWAPGEKSHYVRVNPRMVTGRRISVAHMPSHWWG
ncbi:MAG: pyridoxamine 5'-phosphate oxidase family protein [Friedmanniella sp.]